MFSPKKSEGKLCPLLKKPCVQHQCAWYVHICGTHPQTGESLDRFDCSMIMQPLLLIENSQQQRQTGAAVESFRNEMIRANESSRELLIATAKQNRLLTGG